MISKSRHRPACFTNATRQVGSEGASKPGHPRTLEVVLDHAPRHSEPAVAATPMSLTQSDFGAYMAAETEKWGKVMKFFAARSD